MAIDYDLNALLSDDTQQMVHLTLQQGQFSAIFEQSVSSRYWGMAAVDSAISQAFSELTADKDDGLICRSERA
ncbi:hypothetical protein [Oceanospirillum beijerinckii]|uniref:hypothetical protein n=1 Tax=Oceanospirillum beijerinckii TaxID=64976 RepID=UPI00040AC7C9|nr:hypothetical protein [Oceanospirillum beijerinckii]